MYELLPACARACSTSIAALVEAEPVEDQQVVAVAVADRRKASTTFREIRLRVAVLAVDVDSEERFSAGSRRAPPSGGSMLPPARPPGEDDVVARRAPARSSCGISSGGSWRSQSITTIQRPRLSARPAVIAACWPKFRLSRIARTRGSRARELLKHLPGAVRARDRRRTRSRTTLPTGSSERTRRSWRWREALGAAVDGDDDAELDHVRGAQSTRPG